MFCLRTVVPLAVDKHIEDQNMVPVRHRRIPRMIPFLIMCGLACLPSYAQYSSGTGTPEDPYQIATAQDLVDLGNDPNDYDKYFILTADIDLSGYTFKQAVVASDTAPNIWGFQGTVFSGSFDGNNHKISNLTVAGGAYLALFGMIASQGKVSNLGIVDVNVVGTGKAHENIGGLIGANSGSVVNCYSNGSITGEGSVGGLVGSNGGRIITSNSTNSVTGMKYVGGLVGFNRGNLTTSYSTGVVKGIDDVGGLVGANNLLGNIRSSFWDRETSDRVTSAGGMGLTTVEMQDIDSFLNAGWDFMEETRNGTEDIWWILGGQDYPRLWWEPNEP